MSWSFFCGSEKILSRDHTTDQCQDIPFFQLKRNTLSGNSQGERPPVYLSAALSWQMGGKEPLPSSPHGRALPVAF